MMGASGSLLHSQARTAAFWGVAALLIVPFHALRHSHASQLLRAGASPKLISERLGHSKVGFTLDVYSHLLPGMQEEAAHLIDAGLRAGNGKSAGACHVTLPAPVCKMFAICKPEGNEWFLAQGLIARNCLIWRRGWDSNP